MKLVFLGTGAAEGIPGLWCTCERCRAARQEGDRSLRHRTMALIDDRLLIDCGPDLFAASVRSNLDLSGVETLLITHEHSDHLYLPNLEVRGRGFCPTPLPTLQVYGSAGAIAQIRTLGDDDTLERDLALRPRVVRAFESWSAGRYQVTALRAQHGDSSMEPLFYAIDDGQHRVLYAHDTGPFPEETWTFLDQLARDGERGFDLVSIDATMGLLERAGQTHLSIQQVIEHRDRLSRLGLLRPGSRVLANHFSHNGTPAHRELAERLAGQGVDPAYDGLTVTLA